MKMVFFKADFYLSGEQIFMVREVEWPQSPAPGDLVSLGRAYPLVTVKQVHPWEGGLNVYLETPNERALALALSNDGWYAQDPDPFLAS